MSVCTIPKLPRTIGTICKISSLFQVLIGSQDWSCAAARISAIPWSLHRKNKILKTMKNVLILLITLGALVSCGSAHDDDKGEIAQIAILPPTQSTPDGVLYALTEDGRIFTKKISVPNNVPEDNATWQEIKTKDLPQH
jgi:hypothetical protein